MTSIELKTVLGTLVVGVGLVLALAGCRNGSSPQASVTQGSGSVPTAASPSASHGSTAADQGQGSGMGGGRSDSLVGPASQREPQGVYSISEVDHRVDNKNVVDMIPAHREIQISFRPDGSFMRISWRQGLVALTETGTFRVEPPDQLVLSPTKVNEKNITDGRNTRYKFTLSDDGDELKLWGARGNIAVFHRIKKF